MSTESVRDAAYSTGYMSMANSPGLINFDPQQAAMRTFEQNPVPPTPISVNAWTGVYAQMDKGRILGNVVI